MEEKGKSPNQKKGHGNSDQTEQTSILNPGGFSLIDIDELTRDIPVTWKFKTVSLQVAATRIGISIPKLRDFCRNLPDGVEWFGNGYQLNSWRVEAMRRLIKHTKSRQLSILDFEGNQDD